MDSFSLLLIIDFYFYLFFSNKDNLMEIPSESGTTLALLEQWEKCGLISHAFLNSLLSEGVWSLYKMSMQ
jgi:hypothetical protein